jgi:hypothetical protein
METQGAKMMIQRWRRLVDFFLYEEASTRPAALMRIGLVGLLWARYASDFLLFRNLEPYYLLHGISFFAATTLMFFGAWTRLSSLWTAATVVSFYYYLGYAKGVESYTHHHTYLLGIGACFLALAPCGRSYSWDRWRALKKAERTGSAPPLERGPQWAIRLLALQLSLIYFWTAFDKCSGAFLSGERLENHLMYLFLGSDYPQNAWFHPLMVSVAWVTVSLEFVLCFGLWVKRFQRWLIPVGLVFHGLFYVLLPVGPFSLTMWLFYLAYLDPDAVHNFLDRLSAVPAPSNA